MSLQTLAPDAKASEIVAALQRDGACIVRDVLDAEGLRRVNADVGPWIERSQTGADDFTGRRTKRTGALVARCVDDLTLQERSLATCTMLFALNRPEEMRIHFTGAKNIGVERSKLVGVIAHGARWGGNAVVRRWTSSSCARTKCGNTATVFTASFAKR